MATVPATTVTSAQLGTKVAVSGDEADRLLAEAAGLVADIFATAWRDVPTYVIDECVYRVGRALRDASKTSTGAAQMTATDAPGPRAPADPYASSYPIIRRYVVLGL